MSEKLPEIIHTENPETLSFPSPTEDIVEIPSEKRHDSGTSSSFGGILLALFVAIVGGTALGAGYGVFIALSGQYFVNIGIAMTYPFWINAPAQMGFLWGHLQNQQWRTCIRLFGLSTCLYATCVGWLAAVLDGPGLTFNPLELLSHLSDVSLHGLWIQKMGLTQDLIPLTPYLLTLRFAELVWIFQGGLLSGGAETPFPYCQECHCWMEDEASVRVQYDPPSTKDAHKLAEDFVAYRFSSLFSLDQTIATSEKGLELKVFCCEKCNNRHVMNAIWYRPKPDPNKKEVEQMLESGTGTQLVSDLIVPAEIHSHISKLSTNQLEKTKKAA